MDFQTTIILTNSIIMSATLIATLYRIKIERVQIKAFIEQTRQKSVLLLFRKAIKTKREEILKMGKEELEQFLDNISYLGEDE